LIGEDFHRVAVVEHCVQRYEATIHSGTHSSVSNLGVHTISKIDRGRTRGQRFDLALWCKHVDFCCTNLGPQGIKKVIRIRCVFLPIQHRLQPARCFCISSSSAFICPVGRYTVFSPVVHLVSAHLNFHPLAAASIHVGMQ